MAENSLFVGKWIPADAVDIPAEEIRQHMAQFYKDGSCKIPASLLGKEDAESQMFYFYQVYENGIMKLDSGEPVMSLYHCAMVGENLTLTALNGDAYTFVKAREERERRTFFKPRTAVANPAPEASKKKDKEPEPDREPEAHEWKCPSCGKINQNYVGTCGCGASKPNDKLFNWAEVHPDLVQKPAEEEPAPIAEEPAKEEKSKKPEIPEREPEEYEWRCPSCGKINQNYVGTCGCGASKPNDKLFNWAEVHPDLVQKPAEEEPAPIAEEPAKEEKSKKPEIPEREPEEYEWKCPNCGKINQNYVGTCGCGASKPNDKLFNWADVHPELVQKPAEEEPVIAAEPEVKEEPKKEAAPEREPAEYEWKCPNCGKINQNYVGTCGCGASKPNDKLFNWAEVHPDLAKKPAEEETVVLPEPDKKAEKKAEKAKEAPAEPEKLPGENEWKCPSCGKINQNYVGTCGCGERKPFHPADQK